jgi:hypothetical protein
MSTILYILTGYGPTPPLVILKCWKETYPLGIELIEEIPLELPGSASKELQLGLLAVAFAKTLILRSDTL